MSDPAADPSSATVSRVRIVGTDVYNMGHFVAVWYLHARASHCWLRSTSAGKYTPRHTDLGSHNLTGQARRSD